MTLVNLMIIAFILGYMLGFVCCLFLLYLIRREMEQVAEGERVTIKNCEKSVTNRRKSTNAL